MSIFLKSSYGKRQLTAKQILIDPVLFLAFGFGSGLAKKAPGTFGTLAALPVYWLLMQTGIWVYSLLTLIATLAGIGLCGKAADKLGEHDFNGIVWDELAGFLITMWLVPMTWQTVLAGFFLFRLFDIAKPWPIRSIDRKVQGGLGIMLDDVLAAVFAGGILVFAVSMGWL
jgi:phosphatidylglycerophosphatase A